MYRPYFRLGAVIFLILLLIIFIASRLFDGGDGPAPTPPGPRLPVVRPLPEYANSMAAVSMTIDGELNGEDEHRAIRITVDRFQRQLHILGGYNQNIIGEHKFENNQTAYDTFLRALRNYGFTAKKQNVSTDERGQCPLGTRTIFELRDSGETLSKAWTTSCGTETGNFNGNSTTIRRLFEEQITDYRRLTRDVDLIN